MAAFFTFDINPSNTILFSAPYPNQAAGTTVAITCPDATVITGSASALSGATFNSNQPHLEVKFTIDTINAAIGAGTATAQNPSTTPVTNYTALPFTKFPPGQYRVTYTELSDQVNNVLTKTFILFTTIDDCLYTKIDGLMYDTCCDKCDGSTTKQLVEKLLAVKEGARLDFKYGATADMTEKLTALEHLCEGDFCNCDCGC